MKSKRGVFVGVVAAAAACAVMAVAADERRSPAATTGTVTVTSQPVGATVFVDNGMRGVTPLEVKGLAAGSHRVVVSKAGFLENMRVLDVKGGTASSLDVKLTPMAGRSQDQQLQPEKKSSKMKWIPPLAGGGAAAAVAVMYLTRNHPPDGGSISFTPNATGLTGGTIFHFSSSATDPDGDSLTYSWDFGDGGSGSGANPNHAFATSGTHSVSVTVSDGKASATASASVTTRDVSGTWYGAIYQTTCGNWLTWTLTQTGSSISGTHYDTTNGWRTVSGSVGDPMVVTLTLSSGPVYTGNVNSAFTQISGTVTGYLGGTGNFAACR